LVLRGHNSFCSALGYLQSNWWNDGAFCHHLATRQATLADGGVILNLLLQLQTRRQFTLAVKRHLAWFTNPATDRKMLSLAFVRSFRLHHINLSKKAMFW